MALGEFIKGRKRGGKLQTGNYRSEIPTKHQMELTSALNKKDGCGIVRLYREIINFRRFESNLGSIVVVADTLPLSGSRGLHPSIGSVS